MILLVVDI